MAQTDGSLRAEDVLAQMDSRTRLIAVTAMSNVTGFCPDVDRIIREAHKRGVLVLIDAAQAVVHRAVSVRQMKCDFLCFSGHKIYGPMGIGVLYGRKMYLEEMAPYLYGGDMVVKGDRGEVSYKKSPSKYEAGTQDIAGALGLEAALLYLNRRGFEEMIQYEAELGAYLRERLEAVKGVHVIGEPAVRQPLSGGAVPQPQSGGSVPQLQSGGSVPPIAVFETDKLGAYDIGVLLANSGIAVRSGSHCAYPLMKRMGKESLCRVSLSFYNTKQEIEYMAERLERICGRGKLMDEKDQTDICQSDICQSDIYQTDICRTEKKYIDSLLRLQDPGSQCEYLLMLGMEKPPLDSLRADRYRIGGCRTAIWLRAEDRDGMVHFYSDSDSLLVRGVLSILEELYQARTPEIIKSHPMRFLDYISDDVIYPEIKENGLSKCYQILARM